MTAPARWRVLVHALDRTGPPMLVRSFLRWLAIAHPGDEVDVVAFRGGPLEADLAHHGPVMVVLDDEEAWDHASPPPARVAALTARLSRLGPVDATLLVSTSAGQVLPLLTAPGPVVTWSVEMSDELHWTSGPIPILARTDRWLAGSATTAAALEARGLAATAITIVAEFVERPAPVDAATIAACRAELAAGPDDLLVVGAGIGTDRKGIDLFVEVAAACRRRGLDRTAFAWFGGERDPLFPLVRDEVDRLGLERVSIRPAVADVGPWFAAADAFVHPARQDAFPLVCLHAAAAGTPVVAFAGAGGVEEMFGAAFVGAPYPDVAGLAACIEGLVDPDERRRVGAAQRTRVEATYVADVAAPALRQALADAASHVRSGGAT